MVLRGATRAVGVSPNAAYRHFADRDDLLRAVAIRCQDLMAERMETRLTAATTSTGAEDAWRRLRVAGRSYVEFAIAEPGWFRAAFAIPLDVGMSRAGPGDARRMVTILSSTLDDLVSSGAIPPSSRPGAEFVAWSAVHGIATLLTDGSLRDLAEPDRNAAIERVLNAVSF